MKKEDKATNTSDVIDGDRQTAHTGKQRVDVKQRLNAYLDGSTIHGLSHLSTSQHGNAVTCRRCVWFVIVAASIALTTVWIYNSVMGYYDYESTISYSIERADRLAFPAVTICSKNPHQRSPIETLLSSSAASYESALYGFFGVPHPLTPNFTSILGVKYQEMFEQTSPTLDDIFLQCRIRYQLVECRDYIKLTYMLNGLCYTFQHYEIVQQNGTVDTTLPGTYYGVAVNFLLNANTDEYFGPQSFGAGFSVTGRHQLRG